jgi:LysM repeat protein
MVVGATEGPVGAEGRHTVRAGETLSEIAARNGTTTAAVAGANGIGNPNRILAGQVLVIPGASPAAPATVVHVVAPGETLSEIAAHYGTTSRALADANGITDRNLVRIGQRLTVPAGSGASVPTNTSYTVRAGETLAVIARDHGTTVGAIVAANSLRDPDLIRAGQVLVIPAGTGGSGGGGGGSTTSAYAGTGTSDGRTGVAGTHTVAHGETLTGIAGHYGVSPDALAAANGILRPWSIYGAARLFLSAPNRLPVDVAQCPVPGASFVNDWGFPRSGGRGHAGTDLMAPRGTPVLAPVGGTVSYATGAIGGKQFRLTGDDGMLYIGSHLDAFGSDGRVERGGVIGSVGNTGNAAGGAPHLHFEIHPDGGAAMNPFPVVAAAC